MRPAPALTLDIPAAMGWRLGILSLVSLAASVLAAWVIGAASAQAPLLVGSLAAAAGVCLWLGVRASAVEPCRLRWDGTTWWLGRFAENLDGAVPGRLRVVLDLSFAMLLRFDAVDPLCRTARWIAVRPSGPGDRWPALRRTLYSAPPVVGAAADRSLPGTASTRIEPRE